jgi:hypothetical protein
MMWATWRLFATVVAMTDTGSIAMMSDHSDWPSQPACQRAAQLIYEAPRQQPARLGDHLVTVKMTATCVEVRP